MNIGQAVFVSSTVRESDGPRTGKPEFAFIGRSNVGKSSLINMLLGNKGLAKTSSTPGKTQTVNHFLVDEAWYVVDLPGYGYAAVSKKTKEGFSPMITDYLENRKTLVTTFILIDSRLEPQPIDLRFIEWMGRRGVPFALVFTKTDKISKSAWKVISQLWNKKLGETWEELPPIFAVSSVTRAGRAELLGYLDSLLHS